MHQRIISIVYQNKCLNVVIFEKGAKFIKTDFYKKKKNFVTKTKFRKVEAYKVEQIIS
jgi:hypothetical protein